MIGTKKSRLSAIMFTDIVGYSLKMQENEGITLRLLDKHNEIVYPIVSKWDGSIIKKMGDALLVDFSSAINSVRCAIEVQKSIREYSKNVSEIESIQLRIGIHLGEIFFENDDCFGDGVNIAARIYPLAEPGGICISQDIYNLIYNKLDLVIVSVGPTELKNIKKNINLYKINTEPVKLQSSNNFQNEQYKYNRKDFLNNEKPTAEDTNTSDSMYSFCDFKPRMRGQMRSRFGPHKKMEEIIENFIDDPKKAFDDIKTVFSNFKDEFLWFKCKGVEKTLISTLESNGFRMSISDLSSQTQIKPQRIERILRPHIKLGYLNKEEINGEIFFDLFNMIKYREHLNNQKYKIKKELIEHTTAFLFVNAGLMILNFIINPYFLWFLFVLGGWGIGYIQHIIKYIYDNSFFNKLASSSILNFKLYKSWKRFFELKQGYIGHLFSYLTVNGFLIGINLLIAEEYYWFFFPLIGWGIGLLIHTSKHFLEVKHSLIHIKSLEGNISDKNYVQTGSYDSETNQLRPPFDEIIKETRSVYNELSYMTERLQYFDGKWKEEIITLMENYLSDMLGLAQKASIVSSVVESFSLNELESTKMQIQLKLNESIIDEMKKEYQYSLEVVEKQLNSIQKLSLKQEKLSLKLNSSLLSLKQLKIELARLESVSNVGIIDPIESLRQKSIELSDYVEALDEEIANL